jgi:guanine nucleotide-binding protein subunit alpha
MGCAQGGFSQSKTSKEIDSLINKQTDEVVVLLLGAGESGKSTFFRQIKLNYLSGFDEDERISFKEIIWGNILTSICILIEVTQMEDQVLWEEVQYLMDIEPEELLKEGVNQLLVNFLENKDVKNSMKNSNQFYFLDSAPYFFENIERILTEDYVPTDQDLLYTRIKTTGISEVHYTVEEGSNLEVHFKFVDVGGQRSERRKWLLLFQDVTAIIFFVAMSEYDMTLYEDLSVNRMNESLKLFEEVCNSVWFDTVDVILFLNKKDIFEEKISHSPLKKYFPDYTGDDEYYDASLFISEKFIDMNKNPDKLIFPHFTTAVDPTNFKFVFEAVKQSLIQKAILKNKNAI